MPVRASSWDNAAAPSQCGSLVPVRFRSAFRTRYFLDNGDRTVRQMTDLVSDPEAPHKPHDSALLGRFSSLLPRFWLR